jgi:tetratricopeptide (TPR) repeat protein
VFLENEYLKCTILPDIGGHLYTCVDKISGQPMFYANPSIKKAQIGYRGAWAAFGIEFNFPVSHNWVSMSPVDFAYAAHPDGSGSVWVGNIDRVYGMEWRVELVLRPGSTLLEERVTLYNRSDVRHRYYWWNNAGVQVWDDSRIEYPMRYVASHGFTEVRRWPVGPDGIDLSIIRNQQSGPVSYFIHGSREPFMGIWNPRTQTGTVHYAEYSQLPAKKIWSWGADADGMAWRKALSDNDSAYVEVQAGLFRNQETYAFLNPGNVIRFSEYWMPVRGTGGISRANQAGVVYLEARGASVYAALNVNRRIPGSQIRLMQNGQTLWSGAADLSPEKVWSRSTPAKAEAADVTFELRDHEGKLLLRHTNGQYDWDSDSTIKVGPQPIYRTPDSNSRNEGDWLKPGTDQELNGKTALAMRTYEDGLAKYPGSFQLHVAGGRLAASLQHFTEAEELLKSAQEQDTPNAEIAYYLGIAEDGLGHTREANANFEVAYRQAELHARAAARLAELHARQGDLRDARELLASAAEAAPGDFLLQEQLEAVTRATGGTNDANRIARAALAGNPSSDFLKEETGAPDLPHLAADPYRVLRVATEYMNLGLYARALTVLRRKYLAVPPDESEPGSVLPQDHPLVLYYAAYCEAKLGKDALSNWRAVAGLSTNLVFPSTAMDRVVLEAAVSANDKDATAHDLLGTLLFSKGLYDEGIEQWTAAKRLDPKTPVLDADLGDAWLHVKGDAQRALASYREGVENDPTNAEIYAGLDAAMSLAGAPARERAAALGRYPSVDDPSRSTIPAEVVYQLALTRAEAGEFEDALKLFEGRFFPREEGGVSSDQVLAEIRLMQAEAETKAGRCVDGKAWLAVDSNLALNGAASQAYLRTAAIAKECHDSEQAEQLLQRAAASGGAADAAWAAKAEKLLGADDSAQEQRKLESALTQAERVVDSSSFTGWWWYNIGTIQAALNHKDLAKEAFDKVLLLPDNMMSHHLARTALAGLGIAEASR